MKHKILALLVCIAVVLASVVLQFRPTGASKRVHQHLATAPKTACTDHGEDTFCTHLPLVKIETGGTPIPGAISGERDRFGESIYTVADDGDTMITVSVSVFDDPTKNNHLSDVPAIQTASRFRIRGHMSREFEKAPYLLQFIDDKGEDNDISVMGMDAHSEWILNGPYLDKSLLRNYIFYNLAGDMMDYAPNVRFCELFLDGDYRGIYLMIESIANGDNCRIDLSVTEKGQSVTGYLFRIDRMTEDSLGTPRQIYTLSERSGGHDTDISVRYPGKDNLTASFAKKIELEISAFEKSLGSYDYASDKYGYRSYVDVGNAVDYFLVNEISANMDGGRYSTYIYKRPRDKYRFCVWDFNNACDNTDTENPALKTLVMPGKLYFRDFCMDRDFTDAVIARYRSLRRTILADDYMNDYIDDALSFLGDAIERDSARWADYIASDPLTPKELNVHSQEEAVASLKSWLFHRMDYLDRNIESLTQYSADSRVKKHNEVSDK